MFLFVEKNLIAACCHSFASFSWPSRACKKNSVGIFEYIWHPCSKCILMCFKKDRVDAKSGNAPKSQN